MKNYNLNLDGSFMTEGQILADIVENDRLNTQTKIILGYDFAPPQDERKRMLIAKTGFDPDRYARIQIGMWIRNSYGLWDEANPQAQKRGDTSFVIDGIDHHPNHPDAISGRVADALVQYGISAGWKNLAVTIA